MMVSKNFLILDPFIPQRVHRVEGYDMLIVESQNSTIGVRNIMID